MNQIKLLLIGMLVIGVSLIGMAIYLAMKPEQDTAQQIPQPQFSTPTTTQNITPVKSLPTLQPKRTFPNGNILSDGQDGLYYQNPQNTLESGVAYKYKGSNRVYIYDGEFLRPLTSEAAFFNFYGCSGNMRIIDCAPVYLITVKKPVGAEIR